MDQPQVYMCPPILHLPPTSLPTLSPWVVPEHWFWVPCMMKHCALNLHWSSLLHMVIQFEDICSNRPSYSAARQMLLSVVRVGAPHAVRPGRVPAGHEVNVDAWPASWAMSGRVILLPPASMGPCSTETGKSLRNPDGQLCKRCFQTALG